MTTPSRWYFTIGIWIPSLKMSVVTCPSVPPTSSQCAMQQVKRDQLALVEHRHREREVVQMAAGGVGVVGDQDVARLDVLEPKCLIFALTVSDMPRMNIGRPRPIETVSPFVGEQADGEVQRLVDDEVVGRARQVGLHLLRHGEQTVADDLDGDRVDGWLLRWRAHVRSLPIEI